MLSAGALPTTNGANKPPSAAAAARSGGKGKITRMVSPNLMRARTGHDAVSGAQPPGYKATPRRPPRQCNQAFRQRCRSERNSAPAGGLAMALPGISAPALCTTFRSQAQKIWVDLSRAHRRGRPRSEETITENFLDEIQDAHPQQIFTYSFNKREEGYTGADWEWWLTDDHEWLGLLIQAKRLSSRTHKYEGIKRWSPGAGMAQIDAVLQQAKWKGIDALYC